MKIKFPAVWILAFLFTSCARQYQADFSKDLKEKLEYAIQNFEPQNKAFILNVKAINNETVFQIVHRSYAEQTRHKNDSFGFALQLTFPGHFQTMRAYEKFKASSLPDDFVYYTYEGIPCYVIDLDKDIARTIRLTETLLTDIYGFKDISQFTAEISDEGEVKDWM